MVSYPDRFPRSGYETRFGTNKWSVRPYMVEVIIRVLLARKSTLQLGRLQSRLNVPQPS